MNQEKEKIIFNILKDMYSKELFECHESYETGKYGVNINYKEKLNQLNR